LSPDRGGDNRFRNDAALPSCWALRTWRRRVAALAVLSSEPWAVRWRLGAARVALAMSMHTLRLDTSGRSTQRLRPAIIMSCKKAARAPLAASPVRIRHRYQTQPAHAWFRQWIGQRQCERIQNASLTAALGTDHVLGTAHQPFGRSLDGGVRRRHTASSTAGARARQGDITFLTRPFGHRSFTGRPRYAAASGNANASNLSPLIALTRGGRGRAFNLLPVPLHERSRRCAAGRPDHSGKQHNRPIADRSPGLAGRLC